MARTWTDADTAELKRLHAEGLSQGAIIKQTGWSAGTISKRSRALGLSWVGRMPTEAQLAQQERNERVREDVLEAMWGQAAATLARLTATEFQDLVRGEGGSEVPRKLPFIPSRSLDALARAASTLAKAAAQIEQARAGTQDGSDLRIFLEFMRGTVETTEMDISGGDHARGSNEGVHGEPGGAPGELPPRQPAEGA